MPIGLQAKLLRVLELGEVRAIGSDSVRTVDVRVIAATHRDLSKRVLDGRFRQDLFLRLNVLAVAVPALRERRGDIPELVRHFLEEARQRTPTSPVRFVSPEAMDALARADWPGNVRELASAVERLVVFGKDVTSATGSVSFPPRDCAGPADRTACDSCSLRELCSLRSLSERHVAWVLGQTGGDKARAAQILGVNLSTLYRWQRPRTSD
jgi:two-component system response regulator HydG